MNPLILISPLIGAFYVTLRDASAHNIFNVVFIVLAMFMWKMDLKK